MSRKTFYSKKQLSERKYIEAERSILHRKLGNNVTFINLKSFQNFSLDVLYYIEDIAKKQRLLRQPISEPDILKTFMNSNIYKEDMIPIFIDLTETALFIKKQISENEDRYLITIFHCMHGKDRTGVFNLVYKIVDDYVEGRNELKNFSNKQLIVTI